VNFRAVPRFTCPQWRSAGWLWLPPLGPPSGCPPVSGGAGKEKATWRSPSGGRLWNRRSRAGAVAGVLFAFMAAGGLPVGSHGRGVGIQEARAQNLGMRVVSGVVVDANSASLPGATVFLKDLKSKNIRSFTSDAQGNYRFTQVNMAQDHELWAEKDGKKSPVKTVSSWDTRKEFVQELKLK
jgi:carboxypeptidase family protein